MLIQQLRGLEKGRWISRTVHPEVPRRVEYRLTEVGKRLGPVFFTLLDRAEALGENAGAGNLDEPAGVD